MGEISMQARRYSWLLIVLSAILLVACGSGSETVGDSTSMRIEGTVYYRERLMLPPGATLEVELRDISQPDALGAVLEKTRVELQGGPPYGFLIEYDSGRIDAGKTYSLSALIAVDGAPMFNTTDYIDPFAEGPLEILVRRVAEPDRLAP